MARDDDNVISYGSLDQKTESDSPSSSQNISHDVVNHGHPYSDGIVDSLVSSHSRSADNRVTYWSLIRDNDGFRYYFMSYLVTHAGEWFTYVATIASIEQIHNSNETISRTSISILVSLRLLPSGLFSSIGGVLADTYDRKQIMFMLDLIGSLVALLFLLAYHMKSITALYIATTLQMTVAAIYEPSRSAIVNMLVDDEESLKKSITISELAWSVMTSVGSSLGGIATARLGIPACFFIDSISYFISALLIYNIQGDSFIAKPETKTSSKSNDGFFSRTVDGFSYVKSKPWGAFVFLKFCAALIYGASDVLNVSFSERGPDGSSDMDGSSERLGLLFGAVGAGCFLGPVLVDNFTSMDRVQTIERACILSFAAMTIGCYGLSSVGNFIWMCFFTSIRSAGSSIVWIQSSLLLQKYSDNGMLGRVMSIDYALATLSEAFSAMVGGVVQDRLDLSAENVSFLMSLVGFATFIIWSIYLTLIRN